MNTVFKSEYPWNLHVISCRRLTHLLNEASIDRAALGKWTTEIHEQSFNFPPENSSTVDYAKNHRGKKEIPASAF